MTRPREAGTGREERGWTSGQEVRAAACVPRERLPPVCGLPGAI